MGKLIEVLYLASSDLVADMEYGIQRNGMSKERYDRVIVAGVIRDILSRSLDILKENPERLDYFDES